MGNVVVHPLGRAYRVVQYHVVLIEPIIKIGAECLCAHILFTRTKLRMKLSFALSVLVKF